ncbi:polynucleotide kinase-3'-phosphatase [Striga asiatica]|uniref:Polynucleotide kinase-3'-phosphatase n=1 Tax=Striga asiatica TaxID=4170 RepID=A0A5A7R705_STRAF|nr:polynucleotide kinase-3'-phosphatase [Striga asiatica]
MLSISNGFTLVSVVRSPNAFRLTKLAVDFNRFPRTASPDSSRVLLITVTSSAMSSSSSPSPSASMKIVAEYAKSGRSSCKKCSKAIDSKSLRLGMMSKDPRGFDMTKWHHLQCFPFSSSGSVSSAEAITGFSSLKSSDQKSVKELVNELGQASDKVAKMDEKVDEDPKQGKFKKQKLFTSEEEAKLPLDLAVHASDIKDKYKDATLLPKWKAIQTVIFLEKDDGLHDSRKIAAFDFDGCLAKTSVKRYDYQFLRRKIVDDGADAWSLMYPSIPEKLQNLYKDGYKLVIFTNESNIERWKNKRQAAVDSKIGRLENFIKLVKVPMQVFIACGLSSGEPEDQFRKPKPGMWMIMEKEFNSGLPVDMDQSFYVGDAAGRTDDHSDADIKFAKAIGLKFYVPEEYFLGTD